MLPVSHQMVRAIQDERVRPSLQRYQPLEATRPEPGLSDTDAGEGDVIELIFGAQCEMESISA